jgi:hypothetical protein
MLRFCCLLLALLLMTPAVGSASVQDRADSDTAAAHRAARSWLALVDSGAYAASLDSAAPLLRQLIASGDRWQEYLVISRAGFSSKLHRELMEAEVDPSLPVVPPGRYIRLTFRIRQAKKSATESVVMQAQDEGWRVAMYGVRGEP